MPSHLLSVFWNKLKDFFSSPLWWPHQGSDCVVWYCCLNKIDKSQVRLLVMTCNHFSAPRLSKLLVCIVNCVQVRAMFQKQRVWCLCVDISVIQFLQQYGWFLLLGVVLGFFVRQKLQQYLAKRPRSQSSPQDLHRYGKLSFQHIRLLYNAFSFAFLNGNQM